MLIQGFLVYESKAPAKEVKISEVRVRQKGLGYASSVGLEFEIAKDFAQQLHTANKEEYPPEPEISDKEYDIYFRELIDLEISHPDLKDADSPTNRIGSEPSIIIESSKAIGQSFS